MEAQTRTRTGGVVCFVVDEQVGRRCHDGGENGDDSARKSFRDVPSLEWTPSPLAVDSESPTFRLGLQLDSLPRPGPPSSWATAHYFSTAVHICTHFRIRCPILHLAPLESRDWDSDTPIPVCHNHRRHCALARSTH